MNSPETGELAAAAGFDFVIIDMEHGTLDLPDAAHAVRAVQGRGADAIVRVPSTDPTMIARVLDVGTRGVLIPGIHSAQAAARGAAAAHYAPRGERGACPCVPGFDHGLLPWDRARQHADATHVWLLIEHPDAIADIDLLAAASAAAGATALVLGPFDLAVAMGYEGDHCHPAVRGALEQTIKAAHRAGLDCVAVTLEDHAHASAAAVASWRAAGCRIATALLDRYALGHAYRTTLREISRLD
ncbi:aldolase/citrate lyase family protein [Pseudonocardia kujensis]|nr:aldolase/citrate lyase family protein [Pseudonocardia kujensis]